MSILPASPVQVALFDMDRTLVNRHTARLYVRYLRDCGEMPAWQAAQVGYWLLQYTAGVVDVEAVAKKLLSDYRGKSSQWLFDRCESWYATYVQPHVSATGRQRVEAHKAMGHEVAVATTSIRHGAQPLVSQLEIPHLLCSELEVKDGTLTGSFVHPLSYGQGKLDKAKQLVDQLGSEMSQVTFYTDSITDLPLLEQVGTPIAVNPDFRLKRVARARGWPIETWL